MLKVETIEISKNSILHLFPQLLRKMIVENDTEEVWENLCVVVKGDGIKSTQVNLPTIAPNRSCKIDNLLIEIKDINSILIEPVSYDYTISLVRDEIVLDSSIHSICILPENYWSFLLPAETIVSHICPEDTSVQNVITGACERLEETIKTSSFSDYQTGEPYNVRAQVAAIYSTFTSLKFNVDEGTHNKNQFVIRKPFEVFSCGQGSDIELTLAMASAIEAVHLRPLVVFLQNELLLGVWLEKEHRPTAYNDEVSSLLNLCADGINRMVLLRPKDVISKLPFEEAVSNAERLCREANAKYQGNCYVDVFAARLEMFYLYKNSAFASNEIRKQESINLDDIQSAPITKQDIWERKLLDFSLRNTLLNIRKKTILPFLSFNIDQIEDSLQDENDFQILEFPLSPAPTEEEFGVFSSAIYKEQLEQLALSGISQHRLYSFRKGEDLTTNLKHLYRSSRVAFEENGANTLFLNLGILRWYETKTSKVARHAPLILLPVELIRKGGNAGYQLRLRDEEPIFNITIVEYLKQNYKIDLNTLFPLPTDDSGLDIKKIFTVVRNAIAEQSRWDLLEEIGLGLFSFSKFVMWNDIHNHRIRFEQHPIIKSLIEGRVLSENNNLSIFAEEIDEKVSPKDVALPVDADSSQIEAIVDSGNGKSFILHGPPGTGKSQTITNMIANALYKGKRVLFVAEKRAALEVVQNRLSKIGLGPFCLELHSNKVDKHHVLEQFQKTLDVRHIFPNDSFNIGAQLTSEYKQELMEYVKLLHTTQPNGLSLFDCISRYLSIKGEEISLKNIQLSDSEIQNVAEQINELDVVFQITGHPFDSMFLGFYPKDAQSETLVEINSILKELSSSFSVIQKLLERVKMIFDIPIPDDICQLEAIFTLIDNLLRVDYLNKELLVEMSNTARYNALKEQIELGRKRDSLRDKLVTTYGDKVLSLDARMLDNEYMSAQAQWFIPRFFAFRTLQRKIQGFVPSVNNIEEVKSLIDDYIYYRKYEEKFANSGEQLFELFRNEYNLREDKWDIMELCLNNIYSFCQACKNFDGVRFSEFRDALFKHVDNWTEIFEENAKDLSTLLEECCKREILTLLQNIKNLVDIDWGEERNISNVADKVNKFTRHSAELRNWCQYAIRRKNLLELGLDEVVVYIVSNKKSGKEASEAFLKGIYHNYAQTLIEANDHLLMFNGLLFEKQIQKYCDMVAEFQEQTKRELYCRLAEQIPTIETNAINGSEMGILRRNIANGGRGNSIRNLISQIPHLLPRLSPCMLMSPLSVAQYINLNTQKFDLVIFDEASQMPTSEAIGAIARGKSLVVVGDPKQMPPTSFFQVQQTDDEEADVDDLDSILDDCTAISMPNHFLSWHYRSRHESLISFSNHEYYDGNLMTFPSSDNRDSKVKLVHIKGHYDKGKSRCNKAEADAIVDEVLKRLKAQKNDFKEKKAIQSIGVVSFSKVQQNLIEDILTDALDKDQELKDIAYNDYEPVFVKNLENVQGDERDIILFSIGYGPDANGHVSMNFGPLNKKGGERRLNVAVSRARNEMIVYSTLEPEQIDLKRTSAKGVEGLRNFLEFAQQGRMPIPLSHTICNQEKQGLLLSVSEAIRSMGYQVDTIVGTSNFKVDIAVVSPDNPSKYILGILLDGANYYSTPTTRDRNIVQPKVLASLGWNIIRIWSVDWFNNREFILSYLRKTIALAEKGERISTSFVFPPSKRFTVENERIMKTENPARYIKTSIDSMPTWQVQDALLNTVKDEIAIPEEDLKRVASKRLGFARMGVNVEERLDYELKTLLLSNELQKTNDNKITFGK